MDQSFTKYFGFSGKDPIQINYREPNYKLALTKESVSIIRVIGKNPRFTLGWKYELPSGNLRAVRTKLCNQVENSSPRVDRELLIKPSEDPYEQYSLVTLETLPNWLYVLSKFTDFSFESVKEDRYSSLLELGRRTVTNLLENSKSGRISPPTLFKVRPGQPDLFLTAIVQNSSLMTGLTSIANRHDRIIQGSRNSEYWIHTN